MTKAGFNPLPSAGANRLQCPRMKNRLAQVGIAVLAGALAWFSSQWLFPSAPTRISGAVDTTFTPYVPSPTPTFQPTATWTVEPTITAMPLASGATQAVVEPQDAAPATPRPAYAATPDSEALHRGLMVPILTYHYVEPWPADANLLRKGLTVKPEDFTAQMTYLAEHGYTTISLYDLIDALATGRALPEKSVVITFDDGYAGLFQNAMPIMRQLQQTGTVFVITEFVDQGRAEYLSWPLLKYLWDLGWSVEPHTKTHTGLEGLSYAKQLYEMLGSIETVEANIGARPRFFNYPSGSYDQTTLDLAPQLGLWGGVTTQGGWYHRYDDRYTLTRLRVTGNTDLLHFIEMVEYGR